MSSAAVWRDANAGVVRGASATECHRRGLDHLLNERGVFDRLQRPQLAAERAAAAEEVLEPGDLGGGLWHRLCLLDTPELFHGGADLFLVRRELLVQLHHGLHRAAVAQAGLDGLDAGAVAAQHGVGRQVRIAPVAHLHAHIDLPALKGCRPARNPRSPGRTHRRGEQHIRCPKAGEHCGSQRQQSRGWPAERHAGEGETDGRGAEGPGARA
mmetsp:Transcript_144353/g.350495  ORF Transcript_144353/g.350495 Transcript_144353/m.350495 type:complete len:212 (-) Transcript_144353:7-642(-)